MSSKVQRRRVIIEVLPPSEMRKPFGQNFQYEVIDYKKDEDQRNTAPNTRWRLVGYKRFESVDIQQVNVS